MQYVPLVPDSPLSKYVETMFYLDGYCPENSVERLVPDGACSLVIELDGHVRWIADNETLKPTQHFTEGWFSGPHTNYISISALQNTELIAVRFRPGGLYLLLEDRLSEITNRVVPANELLGDEVATLRRMLTDSPTAEQKLGELHEWLERRMNFETKRPEVIDEVINAIQEKPTVNTISDIVADCGFSRKHLVSLFRRYVGLRPKEFQRVLRFNHALAEIQNERPIRWAEISLDCGYSDQAHFVRDFRHFSGMNPTKFLALDTDRVNFFPIESDKPDLGEDNDSSCKKAP